MGHLVSLEDLPRLSPQQTHWAYCGLDTTGTREVFDALYPRLDEETERTYGFERGLQAPAMAMMRRGVLVNDVARQEALRGLKQELKRTERAINKLPLIQQVWDGTELETGKCPENAGGTGRHRWPRGEPDATRVCSLCGAARTRRAPFNPNSSKQSLHLFRDLFKVPASALRKKDKSIGVDEDVLRRIGKKRPDLTEITDAMLEVRALKKQIGFLGFKLAPDGRIYSSYNVGAAWTGRWSSSKNPRGFGTNMQNIAERHRHIFVADPGHEMFYADLKQAESLLVAYLSGDEGYIEAHKTGDTHTFVTRLVWPGLPWTGDIKQDKAVAKELPPWDPNPGHDYRFQAKRVQHGGNYGLSPHGISMIAKIPGGEAKAAHRNYHSSFPGIGVWQRKTKAEVVESKPLRNPLGRRVRLFGRPWDEHTYKQGLAFRPQSGVVDILNLALWRLWHEHDPELVQVQGQVHDAILGQYPLGRREEARRAIIEAMRVPVEVLGADGKWREMVIPTEIAVGRNWGKKSEDNPHGMEELEDLPEAEAA